MEKQEGEENMVVSGNLTQEKGKQGWLDLQSEELMKFQDLRSFGPRVTEMHK